MPLDERPRQRLLRSGGPSLSDAEILAVLLGNGCREVCTLELAREILDEGGGIEGLIGIRSAALQRRGLGEAKAASVLAALELGRRLAHVDLPEREPLSRPGAVAEALLFQNGRDLSRAQGAGNPHVWFDEPGQETRPRSEVRLRQEPTGAGISYLPGLQPPSPSSTLLRSHRRDGGKGAIRGNPCSNGPPF